MLIYILILSMQLSKAGLALYRFFPQIQQYLYDFTSRFFQAN
jgi:hypothetical protein